jgi:hypothetical protein
MDQGVVVPFPLIQRRLMAPFARGTWEPSLAAGSQYKIGDLVTTNGAVQGSVEKVVETTTATDITKIAVAGQDYDLGADFEPGGRYEYYAARGVPLNLIDPTDEWVFTLAGTLDAAAAAAVAGGEEREVLYNASEGALTIRAGTTNPHIKMRRLWHGAVGDTNAWVVVNFLPGAVL